MSGIVNFPPQLLPFSKKNKEWRKKCVQWADSKTFFNYSLVRKTVIHKKINYDLLNGKIHMSDLELVLNPENVRAGYVPDKIQHYPILNSKLNVLRGEESKRLFDFKVVVTNPNAISEIEENKKGLIVLNLLQLVSDQSQSQEEYDLSLAKMNDYFMYDWLDMREVRGNALLNHYMKEYNIPFLFNQGFMDGMITGEEIYQCDIIGGEPTLERVNPLKIRVFKSGYSNRIEDADIILLEDYWSPGRVIDTFYDVLTKKDIDYIDKMPDHVGLAAVDSMDNIDERFGYVNNNMVGEELASNGFYFDPMNLFSDSISNSLLPYDLAGNLRVIRMYWKSKRKIKKVKSYDPQDGSEVFTFYPETYETNKDLGEEESIYYINEAWEGTKIGDDIYVNMRPRVIQYNRLSNPSRCHFGIVGSIYNLNDARPFSLVDMMKPFNYLYDAIHDRLNKAMAANWGKIVSLDLAKVPKGWDVEKWMYYAKVNHISVTDSFKEGNIGAATGKLAGAMNNASNGVIDAETGNYIQLQINLLAFIKMEMGEVAGISPQREGLVSNRETVGGVERSNLQSSHITEWLFVIHEDVKKRVLEAFLETAKIALKGRSKKFQYILSDGSMKMMDIDGDEFAESDYGLVVDNSTGMQLLLAKMDTLALAALLNQTLSFSTIMKLYSSSSISEKQRLIEKDEKSIQERQAQAQLAEQQGQQLLIQILNEFKMKELQLKEDANIRDNETKLLIAQIGTSQTEEVDDGIQEPEEYSLKDKDTLLEKIRLFDLKLAHDKQVHNDDVQLKEKDLAIKKIQKKIVNK